MDYYNIFVHLFHIIIVGGLFLYVGINRLSSSKYILNLLFIMGIIILFYHSYKIYIKLNKNMNPWVNFFHVIIVAPLLIYIGYNSLIGTDIKRYYFEFLLMLGFSAIGYHIYYLFN